MFIVFLAAIVSFVYFFMHHERTTCVGNAFRDDAEELGTGSGKCERVEWFGSFWRGTYWMGWYSSFNGKFKNGILHGEGSYTSGRSYGEKPDPIGAKYEKFNLHSDWKMGKPEGWGSLSYSPDPYLTITYLGEWRERNLICEPKDCILTLGNSNSVNRLPVDYKGKLKNNVMDGIGKLSAANHALQIHGHFSNGYLYEAINVSVHGLGVIGKMKTITTPTTWKTEGLGEITWDGANSIYSSNGHHITESNRKSKTTEPDSLLLLFDGLRAMIEFQDYFYSHRSFFVKF